MTMTTTLPCFPTATAALLGLMLLSGCGRSKTAPQTGTPPGAVAQVGDRMITAEQLERKLTERSRRHSVPPTAADREAALDELVLFEALLAEARRVGWHTNAELVASFHRTVVARFKEQQLAQLRTTAPTEAEIAVYYQQHLAQFTTAARLRGAVIVLEAAQKATPEKRAEATGKAAELREQAVKETAGTTHFGSLAQRHSIDRPTRYSGGDFGLLTATEIEGRYGAALGKALDALSTPGEISPVIETPLGLGFVKLMERQPETRRPLAQVREAISRQLAQAKHTQAERDFLASAKSKVEIRINRPLLDSLPLPTRNEEPPSLPGAQAYIPNNSL
jgi:parvulin-like peptidyl-prolyl isomerase